MYRKQVTFVIVAVAALAGCRQEPQPATAKQSREIMGTFAHITVVAPDDQTAQVAIEAAYARLEDVNRLMSDYRPDSEISQLSRMPAGQPMTVSAETFHVLAEARKFSEAANGAFDITCMPLVKLWKQAGQDSRLPDEKLLEATRKRCGWAGLKLDPAKSSVTKAAEDLEVDVGAIAKGYSLDLAGKSAAEAGAISSLIDVGGDVLATGTLPGGSPWRIGLQHPFEAGLIQKMVLTNRAVATSGNQQRFSIIDGKRYSHIIDPRTGRPAEQAPSVTVVAPDGLTADAWATAFSVLSVEEGKTLAEKLPNVEVMWMWGSAEKTQSAKTAGFDQYLAD